MLCFVDSRHMSPTRLRLQNHRKAALAIIQHLTVGSNLGYEVGVQLVAAVPLEDARGPAFRSDLLTSRCPSAFAFPWP